MPDRDDLDDDQPDWRRGPAPTTARPPLTQRHPSQADTDAAARRVEANRARARAIDACQLCDPDGYQCDPQGHRLAVCDHTDRTDTNRRGIALIRATLNAKHQNAENQPKNPLPGTTTPKPPKSG